MTKPIITQADVDAIADQLAEEGHKITNDEIHKRLEYRGSRTTVVRCLRNWRKRNATPDMPDIPDMPDALRRTLGSAWRRACEEAFQAAVDGMADYRLAADRRVAEANEQADQAQQERDEARHENEMLQQRLDHTEQARIEAADTAANLRGELDAVNKDFSRHQQESRAAIDKTQTELAHARERLEHEQQNWQGQRKELRDMIDQANDRYEADTEKLLQRIENERMETAAVREANKEIHSQLANANADLRAAQQEIAGLKTQAANAEQTAEQRRAEHEQGIAGWKEALHDVRNSLNAARTAEKEAQERAAQLLSELHKTQERADLAEQIKRLWEDKDHGEPEADRRE